MNRTVIALIAVSLGALLPVPTAQSLLIPECAQEEIDDVRLPELPGLGDLVQPQARARELPCSEVPSCEALVGEVAPYVFQGPDVCDPQVALCPKGSYGAKVNDLGTCVGVMIDDPQVELCPKGSYGVVVDGKGSCMELQAGLEPCDGGSYGIQSTWHDACIVPSVPGVEVAPKPKGGACAASDDGSGIGNPHASCRLSCGTGSELAIGVASADKPPGDATAYGSVNCGDTGGSCTPTPKACFGASPKPTNKGDDAGSCSGSVDEWIDDPMTVACVATVGVDFGDDDPTESARKAICRAYPDFPTCDHSFATMSANCIAAHPELLGHGESVVSGLFPPQFAALPVYAYVGGLFLPDGSITTVSYRAGDPACSVA